MGSPSACDECGKKFKVFGSKKKCKHCMDVVCKTCLAGHLELKHTHVGLPPRSFRRRKSLELFDAAGNAPDQEDLQFLSPIRASAIEMEYPDPDSPDVLEGVEDVEAVSDDDDDGEFDMEDEDPELDDDLMIPSLARQTSIEEEEMQHREMQKIQVAVAVWAMKEKQAKQKLRRKKDSYCSMKPEDWANCDQEVCSLCGVTYAVIATVMVWVCFAIMFATYFRARSLPATFVF